MKITILFFLFFSLNAETEISGTWKVFDVDYISKDNSIEGLAKETMVERRLMDCNYIFKIEDDSISVITNSSLLDKTELVKVTKNKLHLSNKIINYELDEAKKFCKFIFNDNVILYAEKVEE